MKLLKNKKLADVEPYEGFLDSGLSHYGNVKLKTKKIKRVLMWWDNGYSDEPSFAAIFLMKDDTFFTISGGHDYTGWDCQSSLDGSQHDSLIEAWNETTVDDRHMLLLGTLLGSNEYVWGSR